MKRTWIRKLAAFLLAAALMAAPCYAATIGGAVVTGEDVRLRTTMDTSTDANILMEMEKDTFLLVEEKLNGWYKVVCNGVEGYVSAAFADFSENLEGTYDFAAATCGTDVILRGEATTASCIMMYLRQNETAVKILGVSGQWLKVKEAGGFVGYVRSDLLRYKPDTPAAAQAPAAAAPAAVPAAAPAPAPAATVYAAAPATPVLSNGTAGDAIAQTALLYKGYAYVWGGMSPLTGFDCSGLCNYVCSVNGISLHRVAQDIYSYDGVFVAWDDLQPGDILCFGYGPYSVGHVGIYIGNGQMIHASTYTTGVIISDLSGYYTTNFVGAKRVV